jgi:FkbM family methyltransferase
MEKIMRKVFIDCGAWTGDSVEVFRKYYKDYEIFAFECHPDLKDNLKRMSKDLGFNFVDKAVWIKDEKISLFLGKGSLTQSTTVFSSKKKYIDRDNPVEIYAIDFSKWILNMFDRDDYIVCKMNIEGAEYPVLDKMIKDDSIDYVNKLFISWHWRKLKGFSEVQHRKIKNGVEERTSLMRWRFVNDVERNPFE